MLIKNEFEVPQSVEHCWELLQDMPQVASLLPGANLDREVGPDQYEGTVDIRMGPVRMEFAGRAEITDRQEEEGLIVVRATGADRKGRGQAAMDLRARLVTSETGTRIVLEQELQLSGAAAQFGRGMVSDVNAVLMSDFAANMRAALDAIERGEVPVARETARAAGGFMIAVRAAWMALKRVAARFFLPYQPDRV